MRTTAPGHRPWSGRAGPSNRIAFLPLVALGMGLAACSEDTQPDPMGPPPTANIEVTSPIGDMVATDRSVQLAAVATDASGSTVSASFDWLSSEESVATVDATGLVETRSAGGSTISASADGVSGSLALQVIDVDDTRIATLLEDPFTEALVTALSDTPRGALGDAIDRCSGALDTGDVTELLACLDDISDGSSTDPTDRVLLAVAGVMAERSGQHIDLGSS